MSKLRTKILGVYTVVMVVSALLQQAFTTLLFERSDKHLVSDLSTGLSFLVAGVIVALVALNRYLAPIEAFQRDPDALDRDARVGIQGLLSRIPGFLFAWNLVLFPVSALASAFLQMLLGTPFPGGLDLVLILSLNLAFGFMASLQQMNWIESLSLGLRTKLGLTSVEGKEREMSLRQRLFLVNLGTVVLSGLLASMAALGFYREVVAYYAGLGADALSAASAVSAQAVNENELKVMVQMFLQFLAVLAWSVVLTNTALGTVIRQLKGLEARVAEMAGGSGDLGRRAEVVFFDEVGLLTGRINALMERLQHVVGAIQATSGQVLESTTRVRETSRQAEENLARVEDAKVSAFQALGGQGEALGHTLEVAQLLQSSSDEVKKAAADQNEAVTRGAAAMEQMASSVAQVSSLTAQADGLATGLRATSEQGGRSIEAVRSAMETIQAAARAVAGTVATIKKTASQTNLLAMNAAIEAAHAGASGLGFAVVASEVRTLAENSSQGARTIAGLMKDMDSKIAEGDRLAREAGEAFTRIFDLVVQTSEVMGTVARAMEEQKAGSETILSTTRTLRDASAHIGAITGDQAAYAGQINQSVMVLLETGAVMVMAQDVQSRAMNDLADLIVTVAREANQNLEGAETLGRTVEGFTVK